MELNKVKDWIGKNKLATGLLVLVLVFVSSLIFNYWESYKYDTSYYYDGGIISSPEFVSDSSLFEGFLEKSTESRTQSSSSELEIRSGQVEVESEDAEKEFEMLKAFVESSDGYIEESGKQEGSMELRITAQVRIPVAGFDLFVESLQENFEVENFTLQNYRIEVQHQLDELAIVNQTLEDFDTMRKKIGDLDLDTDNIKLLAEITREMRLLARERDRLERELSGQTKQSDLATIHVVFVEELDIDFELWPDDLRNRFIDNVNNAFDSIFTTLASILTNSFVLFIKVVEYIVYAVVIALPVVFAWKVLKKVRKN